ncbi:MAG: hypothetical protein ACXWRA_06535 [Pseudobdellovibrionaceae bacterium]
MKSLMHSYLRIAICVLLSLHPLAYTYAFTTEASPESGDDLGVAKSLLRLRLLYEYSQLQSVNDFVAKFISDRPESEKKEVKKRLSKLKTLPKLEIIENGVSFSADSLILKVDMREMEKHRFIVNGQAFTVSGKSSVLTQAEILADLIQHPRKGRYGALFSIIVPQAQASESSLAIFLALVGTAVMQQIISHYMPNGLDVFDYSYCDWHVRVINKGVNPENPIFCKAYRNEKKDLAKANPEITSVQRALTDGSPNGTKYKTGEGEVCPFQTKDGHYHGIVTVISAVDVIHQGKDADVQSSMEAKDSGVVRIYALLDGAKLKSASIYRDSYVDGKSVSVMEAAYKVDVNSVLEKIILMPDKTPGVGTTSKNGKHSSLSKQNKEDLETQIRADADLKDNPQMRAKQAYYQGLFKHLGDRLKACKTKADEKEAAKLAPPSSTQTGSKESGKGGRSGGVDGPGYSGYSGEWGSK